MPKKRPTIPYKTKSLLQQEINSSCPFCDDLNISHFEIHHINEIPENNDFSNLLMLCPTCHSKITKNDISTKEVLQVKSYLALKNKKKREKDKGASSIQIKGNVKNTTVANSITAETIIIKSHSKPKIEYAEGAIGKNVGMKNYIKHLIDRYNEFKESEVGKGNLRYAGIYSSIKKEFKASVFQISNDQFNNLSTYLQKRVDGTRLGRINTGKGVKNYSGYIDSSAESVIDIAEKAMKAEQRFQKKKEIEQLLESEKGMELAYIEVKTVLAEVKRIETEIKSKTANWQIKVRENRHSGCDVISYGYYLTFQFHTQFSNNLQGSYFSIILFQGYFDEYGHGDPFSENKLLAKVRYSYDIIGENCRGWKPNEYNGKFIDSNSLVNEWFEKFMKYAIEGKGNSH